MNADRESCTGQAPFPARYRASIGEHLFSDRAPSVIGHKRTCLRPLRLEFTGSFLGQRLDTPQDIRFLDITPWKHDI
jgi:hypothetical protein